MRLLPEEETPSHNNAAKEAGSPQSHQEAHEVETDNSLTSAKEHQPSSPPHASGSLASKISDTVSSEESCPSQSQPNSPPENISDERAVRFVTTAPATGKPTRISLAIPQVKNPKSLPGRTRSPPGSSQPLEKIRKVENRSQIRAREFLENVAPEQLTAYEEYNSETSDHSSSHEASADIATSSSFRPRLEDLEGLPGRAGKAPVSQNDKTEADTSAHRRQSSSASLISPTSEIPPTLPSSSRTPETTVSPRSSPINKSPSRMENMMRSMLEKMNFLAFRRPYRAVEWCDREEMPKVIRQCCQNMLLQQWVRRLPAIQDHSPAQVAAVPLKSIVNEVAAASQTRLVVIDFCAGGGGPTPVFERLINAERGKEGDTLLEFRMSDLHPNQPAWEELCKKSDNLTFIPESVNAMEPPKQVVSVHSKSSIAWPDQAPARKTTTRIFRLFNLSFHHFDDETAREVLKSTIQTAEGIAIIELQDRRFGTLLMMACNCLLCCLVTPFWFPPFSSGFRPRRQNLIQNLWTYIGVLPFILCWDGLASCIRTREFEEVMKLVGEATGETPNIKFDKQGENVDRYCDIAGWRFTFHRQMHTFPFGYVNMITGAKLPLRMDSVQGRKRSIIKLTTPIETPLLEETEFKFGTSSKSDAVLRERFSFLPPPDDSLENEQSKATSENDACFTGKSKSAGATARGLYASSAPLDPEARSLPEPSTAPDLRMTPASSRSSSPSRPASSPRPSFGGRGSPLQSHPINEGGGPS